jgi:uncharacterized protein YndB with AHSA1/START domain
METEPLVVEKTIKAPVDKVWKAITENNQMKLWYFELADFRPEIGFKFQFIAGPEEKKYIHHCEVTEVIPGRKITYSWHYDGYAGKSFVTFELFSEAGSTRLNLMHKGIETFPSNDPNFARSSFAEGWNFITNNLKEFVETKMV